MSKWSEQFLGHIIMCLAKSLEAYWNIIAFVTVGAASAVYFTWLRHVGVAIVLSIWINCFDGSRMRPNIDEWSTILLAGVFLCARNYCFIFGDKFTNPNSAGVFQSFIPVYGVLAACTFGDEKSAWYKIVGTLFAIGGGLLYGWDDMGQEMHLVPSIGFACFVLEGFVFTIALSCWRQLTQTMTPLAAMCWVSRVSAIISTVAMGFVYYFELEENVFVINTPLICGLLYAIFGIQIFVWFLISFANQFLTSDEISIYDPSQLLFTMLFVYLQFGETISRLQCCAITIVLLSVFLVMSEKKELLDWPEPSVDLSSELIPVQAEDTNYKTVPKSALERI